jgi:dihydrofolate reductase
MNLIVACDPDGGIGFQNKLPWHLLEQDLTRFKSLTTGKTVIMGRNTWDSLPIHPLPGRTNVIVSSNLTSDLKQVVIESDISEISKYQDAWIIGGSKLIDQCWNLINTVHLTMTLSKYTCDSFINLVKLQNMFIQIHSEKYSDNTYTIWKKK